MLMYNSEYNKAHANDETFFVAAPVIKPDTQHIHSENCMATKTLVRNARPDDVPQIAQFIRDLAAYEKLSDQCFVKEEQLREHIFGARPYCEVLIGEDESGPAGFALFFHNYSTFLAKPGIYLEDIFVLPERRGGGLGKALFTAVARVAVQRNCGRMEWAVLDWNEPAIGFYKKLGATLMDDWTTCRLTGDALRAIGA
jgi:GNAT superfamily N-acetyltransferase